MGATQVSIGGMDKQNVVYTYNGILLSLKMEGNDTCYNMGEPWKHAKWNKPNTKEQISFHLYEASRVVRLIETENWIVVARGWREGEMRIII